MIASLLERLPDERRLRLQRRWRRTIHPAWMGTLRRTTPLSDAWGYDRGTPVDRYYIEGFLRKHRADITGRVLEVKDSTYTEMFGTGVRESAVLDIDAGNPRATVIADLAAADALPSDRYDCLVLTQTLQFIYDTPGALAHARRILRPGGVLLLTVPAASRLDRRLSDYWRFTPASCAALVTQAFPAEMVSVEGYGNVLSLVAFLMGMAREELSIGELAVHDERTPVIVAVRAKKPDHAVG